jgi:putative heme-binding domain-containing protein
MFTKWMLAGVLCGSVSQPLEFRQAAPANQQATLVPADLAAGKRTFERHCALCHGIDGKGGRGPNLNRARLVHAPDDAALKGVISEGIPPEMPGAWLLSEEDVANVAAYVRAMGKIPADPLPGDPGRGAGVYAKSGCAGCHIVGGAGSGFGPDLSEVGDRRSAAYLRGAITKPSASLPEGFLYVKAVTATGEAIEGIRANEDTFSIQIRDASGRFHSLRKQELKDLQKLRGQSPMPAYEGILDRAALDDLVAYLAVQRAKE